MLTLWHASFQTGALRLPQHHLQFPYNIWSVVGLERWSNLLRGPANHMKGIKLASKYSIFPRIWSDQNMLISDEQLNYLHGREWCIIPHIFSIIFLSWQVHMHKDCPLTNVVKEVTCDKFLKNLNIWVKRDKQDHKIYHIRYRKRFLLISI